MLAGLLRARRALAQYLASPLVAAPLTAMAARRHGDGRSPARVHRSSQHHGLVQFALGYSLSAALRLRRRPRRVGERRCLRPRLHQRGTVVGRKSAARHAVAVAAAASGITLAGRAVPAQDETKHFKLIGTTGTGKSTAIQEMLSRAGARRPCRHRRSGRRLSAAILSSRSAGTWYSIPSTRAR